MIDFTVCLSGFSLGLFAGLVATLIDIIISSLARVALGQ